MFDWNEIGVERKHFNDYKDESQASFARVVKQEMEERLGIDSRPLEEWLRVFNLANPVLIVDYALNRFDIEQESKEVLEALVQQYLLAEGGENDG